MDHSLLTEQQLQKKYNSLPDKLRELLNSESVIETLRQISRSHYLDEERSLILEQLVGLVILGFLSVEELSQEVQENLRLNPKHSSELTQELNRKIFSPIKSDLEKIYSPADSAFAAASAKEAALAEEGRPPEPRPLPKATAGEAKPAPFPTIPTVPEAQKVPTAQPKVPAEPLKIVPTTPVPADKPFILHQETEAESAAEKKKVTLPAIGWFRKAIPKTEAPVKVELEIFGPEKKPFDIAQGKEPPIAKTEAPKQKIVHYRETEVSTPFGKPFDAAQGKPPEKPQAKPEEPQPSPEATAGEAKVINLDSFE